MNKSYKYQSTEYLKEFSNTLSLKKLENELTNNPGKRLQYVTAGYLYYNKEKDDLTKYPFLSKIRNEFSISIKNNNELDPYWKINNSYDVRINKSNHNRSIKEKIRKEIIQYTNKQDIKLYKLSSESNIDNSSLSRFLDGKLSELSINKAMNPLRLLREKYGK